MRKLLLIAIFFSLSSCYVTTESQDMQMLQKKYPKAGIMRVKNNQYIVADTLHTYSIILSDNGDLFTIVKIR
jgi:hypothetical protein